MILSFDTITNLKLIFEFKRKVWEILRVTFWGFAKWRKIEAESFDLDDT